MSTLPIPKFRSIEEWYEHGKHHNHGTMNVAFIVPVEGNMHTQPRYDVVRLLYLSGVMTCIGRELPIRIARAVARRDSGRDGQALTDAEMKMGRWTHSAWLNNHECARSEAYGEKSMSAQDIRQQRLDAQNDPNKPEGACCNNERRAYNGGCGNCGDPCL